VPVDSRVGRQVFGQVLPITSILELIKDTIKNLPFRPIGGPGSLLLGEDLKQQGFKDAPFCVGEAAGVRHDD
jgi:hypothetical protein